MFICLAVPFSTIAAIRYVNVNSSNPTPPYTNWATAATVIQDAVDAALPGDEVVVTNGVYQSGGRAVDGFLTNRVAVMKPLILRSVNGPGVTVIRGYQVPGTTNGDAAVRCAYLTNGAALVGFTLTNGATLLHSGAGNFPRADFGGGVYCESNAVVSNCVLVRNTALRVGGAAYGGTLNDCTLDGNTAEVGGGAGQATLNRCTLTHNTAEHGGGADVSALSNCTLVGNRASHGGGAYSGWLTNCLITGNTAGDQGGGVAGGLLINCTIVGNSAASGGGASFAWVCDWDCFTDPSHLYNCIVYDNTARDGANYWGEVLLNYSRTTPFPTNGVGNLTNAPLFVDAAAGNFRLQPTSPCINAGLNSYPPVGPDLDSNPRIVGGTVDIGAYEFQSPQSTISYAWLQQYGLPTDGSADLADADQDGHNAWQEWKAWTNPTNALSVLKVLVPQPATNGVRVVWQSASGQSYFLERSTNAGASFTLFRSNMLGQAGTTSVTDTNTIGLGASLYRVGVR